MEVEILFTEKQKFRQWWLFAILGGINGFLLFAAYKQLIIGQPFGYKPMSNTGLLIAVALILVITILLIGARLETLIKKDGIYVRFFPFHLKFKHYTWDELSKSFVRQYSPITEYGGWGLRLGLFGKGNAFNVSGDQGLQLEFTNSKRLLIGTIKPNEITLVLREIGQIKS